MGSLDGKAAVVTGASRNIGRAIALALAADGAAVLVNGRSDGEAAEAVADEIRSAGGRAVAHLADVSDEGAVAAMADAALASFGSIDILVNNAAMRARQSLAETTLEDWRRVMGVILEGAFLCARACVPHMIDAGGGRIVNIGGLSAHTGDGARAHVVSAKAGLVGLTRALAVEFASHGITVNCVVPGTIDTVRGDSGRQPAQYAERMKALIDRKGRPEELASMVAHLCQPDSAYLTAQTIHVSGGRFLT